MSAMMRAAGTRARGMRHLVSRALPRRKKSSGWTLVSAVGAFLEQTPPLLLCGGEGGSKGEGGAWVKCWVEAETRAQRCCRN